ncbi:MAG: tRNA pseudouridine(38-40) synthase TruA [Clostridiaceae bacterium]|nr:tRNA pseudouridine(38-40) synthase TruA [Clostridiaceae bacterium]
MRRNIKLTIEYDGTAYHGWQSQENAVTVQDTVTAAVCSLTGENSSLTGSSRTDTGVHAMGFVCNFFTDSAIPADKFSFALNTHLPEDIVVKKSEEAAPDFHSRFSAKGKKYTYLIYNSTFPSALLRHRAYHVYYPLDVGAMNEAAAHFTGTRDFCAFSASGGSAKTTVRTITEATVTAVSYCGGISKQSDIAPNGMHGSKPDRSDPVLNGISASGGSLIEFSIKGDGFLYNMVRIITGTLVEVGFGKLKPEEIPEIIRSLDRRRAGRTAPAHGLYLSEVYY